MIFYEPWSIVWMEDEIGGRLRHKDVKSNMYFRITYCTVN